MKEYLGSYDARMALGVSKPTLYLLVKKGVLRRKKLKGVRKYLYMKEDIDYLIGNNIKNPDTGRFDLVGFDPQNRRNDGK